jgi:hypothetical protein
VASMKTEQIVVANVPVPSISFSSSRRSGRAAGSRSLARLWTRPDLPPDPSLGEVVLGAGVLWLSATMGRYGGQDDRGEIHGLTG